MIDKQKNAEYDVWKLYLFELKSPMTRQKYQGRIKKFFNYCGIEGESIEEKSRNFILKINQQDTQWVFDRVLNFLSYQIERVNRKEIGGATV